MTPSPPSAPPTPFSADPNPLPAQPPKKKSGFPVIAMIAVVVLVPLGLCLLIGGAGFLMAKSAKPGPLKPGDRAALVTGEDLFAATSRDAPAKPKTEKAQRSKLFDGSVQLEYEYQSKTPPLYVATTLTLETSLEAAKTSYLTQAVGGAAGVAIGASNVKLEDRDELFRWGDESKLQVLQVDGKPAGNFFVARKGTRVFLTIFSGVYFDDPEAFRSLVEPKLAALLSLER